MRKICIIIFIICGFVSAAISHEDDEEHAAWYKSLKQPGNGGSCCDMTDCKNVLTRVGKEGYEVFINDKWVKVDPSRVINNKDNPTMGPVACYNPYDFIYCFVDGWRL